MSHLARWMLAVFVCGLLMAVGSVQAEDAATFKISQDVLVLGQGDEQITLYLRPDESSPVLTTFPTGVVVHITSEPVNVLGATWLRILGYPTEDWAQAKLDGVDHFALWTDELDQKVAAKAVSNVIQNPSDSMAFYRWGLVYMNHAQYIEAIAQFTKALDLNPEHAMSYYFRGYAYSQLKQYTRALRDLTDAISIDPTPLFFYTELGNVYSSLGNVDRALDAYDVAIARNPNYLPARNDRGIIFTDLGNYSSAFQEFRTIIEADPLYARAYNNRAIIYSRQLDFRSAIDNYKMAISAQPDYVDAIISLGEAYHDVQDCTHAFKQFDKALKLNPDMKRAYFGRALCNIEIGNYSGGQADVDRYLEAVPDNKNTLYTIGTVYYLQGLYPQAIEYLSRAIKLDSHYLTSVMDKQSPPNEENRQDQGKVS